MTQMKDNPNGRQPKWKTTQMETTQMDDSRYKLYFSTQGYPATVAVAVQPQPKQILFLLEY